METDVKGQQQSSHRFVDALATLGLLNNIKTVEELNMGYNWILKSSNFSSQIVPVCMETEMEEKDAGFCWYKPPPHPPTAPCK